MHRAHMHVRHIQCCQRGWLLRLCALARWYLYFDNAMLLCYCEERVAAFPFLDTVNVIAQRVPLAARCKRMKVRGVGPHGETGAASLHDSGWLDTFAGGLRTEPVRGERQVEDRRGTGREGNSKELQSTLRQGARRPSPEDLGQGRSYASAEVSANRLFLIAMRIANDFLKIHSVLWRSCIMKTIYC